MKKLSCLIIAGEKSGEEHALGFLHQIREKVSNIDFWGVGGDQLADEDVELIYHLKDFSSWGFSEVITKIPFYKKAEDRLFKETLARNCQVAILIDFQTFNLRLAKRLKSVGVDVLYYVAPKAWVWKSYRTKILQKTVHTLFTIIPFEKSWFYERGLKRVISAQHPLVTTYESEIKTRKLDLKDKPYTSFQRRVRLLLLPGSRNFEVRELLGIFMQVVSHLKSFHFELGLVPSPNVDEALYRPYLNSLTKVFHHDELGKAFEWADMGLAASGTVTLTCALFGLPTVVAYRASLLNEFIFYNFMNYKGYVSLANIVHQDEVFPEFIQEKCSSYNLAKGLERWLVDQSAYESIKKKLLMTLKLLKGEDKEAGYCMANVIYNAYNNDAIFVEEGVIK